MDKSRKYIIILSVVAAVLAVCLVLSFALLLPYIKSKSGKDPGSVSESTSEVTSEITTESTTEGESTSESTAESTTAPQNTDAEPDTHGHEDFFQYANEYVTAKNYVNLRSSMEQGTDENIVCVLVNGDTALRTGIGENGWSRVEYNSQTLYCISSYLTTDLSYTPPADSTDGFKTKFTDVNERVTAKEATNLRDRPSVMEPSKVVVQLRHGEVATRTGIANEGWSRVEYNGQTLYCISSYLEPADE